MKVALVNPPWSFDGSVYFGCRAPHLPIELGYAFALLQRAGHSPSIFDAQLMGWRMGELREAVAAFGPHMTVVVTAPSYLFWRCAPPELRVPKETLRALAGVAGTTVAIGPHASVTPAATLRKLGADAVVLGEAEEILVKLASTERADWETVPSIAYRQDGVARLQGVPHASDLRALPALRWAPEMLVRHEHHHHRFDDGKVGLGAEIEATRGCPYACTFCAKNDFRDRYRKRPLAVVLSELDALIANGVRYVYFIDEIFLPDEALLDALAERDVVFGVQLRVDNWSPEMLDRLGAAGCVSIEAGIESLTEAGRSLLAKKCKLGTAELTERLVRAKRSVAFVQANLIDAKTDDPAEVATWREHLRERGVWANEPVPMFAYPSSPSYRKRWGRPDDDAWERAHEEYLREFSLFSDIQESRPLSLAELEAEDLRG